MLKNNIGVEGANAISHACGESNTLQTVLGLKGQAQADFSSKGWGVPEAILMSAELKVNRALIKLSIGDNALGHGIQTICESLCHNDTLQAITFANQDRNSEYKMGAAGAKHVADMC